MVYIKRKWEKNNDKKTFIIHNIIIIVDDDYDEQGTCVFIVHILLL